MKPLLLILILSISAARLAGQDSLIVSSRADSLLTYASRFLGTPYGNRGSDTTSFDCSGFVCHVYGKFGVKLPHGSGAQREICEVIDLEDVQPGDLLFFSGRKISKSVIGHVALVQEVEDGKIRMIHATVQAGVISEIMQESSYFVPRFICAGRLSPQP